MPWEENRKDEVVYKIFLFAIRCLEIYQCCHMSNFINSKKLPCDSEKINTISFGKVYLFYLFVPLWYCYWLSYSLLTRYQLKYLCLIQIVYQILRFCINFQNFLTASCFYPNVKTDLETG